MSYCNKHRHLATQDAMSGRCQECEIAALRERVNELEEHRAELIATLDSRTAGWRESAEKAERERDAAYLRLWPADAAIKARHDLGEKYPSALAEAREDIKALATICQALGERRIIACAAHTEGDWHAWQRIRDRRLLEVSE